jgi:hypothetical protein
VEASLAGAPQWMRDCYQAICEELRRCGPVHEDAVGVGVFLKTDRKLAEFRPRAKTVRLTLWLPGPVEHPRLLPISEPAAARVYHNFTLRSVEDLDEDLLELVGEAYDFATDDSG